MRADLTHFRDAILATPDITPNHDALLIERSGRLCCHYAPFEYINIAAKVVVAGITPGAQQAKNALDARLHELRARINALCIDSK